MRQGIIVGTALLLLVFFGYLFRSRNIVSHKKETPVVAATIWPLSRIITEVAGDTVSVVTILPSGVSPHTFDPSPSTIRALTGATAVFAIGHGLDDWSTTIAQAAGIRERVVVDEGQTLLSSLDEDGAGQQDPHYFLAPTNAVRIARQVAVFLSGRYPKYASLYAGNADAFAVSMKKLREELTAELIAAGNPPIATFHGAWGYFARDFGIPVSAVFEEYPGKEPTPQYLAEFSRAVRQSGVRVIFGEPQFSTAPLEAIAKDLGVTLSVLDPEGGASGAQTYGDFLTYNVDQIIGATK